MSNGDRNILRAMLVGTAIALVTATAASPVLANAAQARGNAVELNIPAQDLRSALAEFARQTGQQLLYAPELVEGRRSAAVVGRYSPRDAMIRLLEGSGIGFRTAPSGAFLLSDAGYSSSGEVQAGGTPAEVESAEQETILVTGTQIRGARTASPSTVITQREMRDAGFSDIGEAVRSIPQNFSGGQNPGVQLSVGAGVQNQNATSGSSLNLRGLGPDASLTLLNGRRLSYNGFVQAVDLSVVPIGAINRIEIVPDGASAIYGSDAVAGIANIILRRDYSGLETRIRVGGTTDGGGTEVQVGGVTGARWRSGGLMLAYEYTSADRILTEQRDYLAYMPGPTTLTPERRQHSAIFTMHQSLSGDLEFNLDGLYTRRTTERLLNAVAQFTEDNKSADIYTLAPSFRLTVGNDWLLTLGGAYSRDESRTFTRQILPNGTLIREVRGCWCNTASSIQLDGEGPIFRLPGGDARLAIGVGLRNNDFRDLIEGSTSIITGSSRSYFAFGELYAPLIGPMQRIAGISRLIGTAALRYERYPGLEDVVTPKFGIIYEPVPDFSLRASWGRSFKTATLSQASANRILYLYPAASLGATGYPATATVLMPFGGNSDLRPERAETWSASLAFHPSVVPSLRIELSYFDVDYRDRVVRPLEQVGRTFTDPAVGQFLILNPSSQLVADTISGLGGITSNFTGRPLDPASVVAIANNFYANAARSRVRGIDASLAYGFPLGPGRAQVRGSASWLDGDRVNLEGQTPFDTVGIIYNPPRFRGRAGIVWSGDIGLTVGAFANHSSNITNINRTPNEYTGGFTTVDTTLGYRTGAERGFLSNMELMLSVQNVFNRRPPEVTPIAAILVNFDSTNYSAIGRYVSLSVMRRW